MKVRGLTAVLLALATVALLVPAASASTRTWWAQGWWAHDHVYRARTLQVSGDSTYFMRHMKWAHWGSDRARKGRAAVNDCKPSCAQGTFHTYPVRVRLVKAKHVCGRRFFTKIVIVYIKARPKHMPKRDARAYSIVC